MTNHKPIIAYLLYDTEQRFEITEYFGKIGKHFLKKKDTSNDFFPVFFLNPEGKLTLCKTFNDVS